MAEKKWDPSNAADWMEESARNLGHDFREMPYEERGGGMGEPLRASAGALYYGAFEGIGTANEEDFRDWLRKQVGWDQDTIDDAVAEVYEASA